MMGSFLTRGLVMVLGYTYPAYECFKTVEMNKPEIEQLRFWCQYSILVAVLTVFERIGDTFVSWLPMYSEAKLAFFVYLWYPKTRGTTYVYDTFLRPYVAKHETEIDQNLLELRAKAGDIAVLYWQKAASYGQTRVLDILQFVTSQSPRPRPAQTQQQHPIVRQPPPTAPTHQPSPTHQPQRLAVEGPTAATAAAVKQQQEPGQETGPTPSPTAAVEAATSQSTEPKEGEAMEIESVPNESADPPPQEHVMDETIRVTRAKLRKTRAAASSSNR